MTSRPRRRFWLKLAAGLLFAVVAYGGAYLACVKPLPTPLLLGGSGWDPTYYVLPYYDPRIPLQVAGPIFAPALWVDRTLFPERWDDAPFNGGHTPPPRPRWREFWWE